MTQKETFTISLSIEVLTLYDLVNNIGKLSHTILVSNFISIDPQSLNRLSDAKRRREEMYGLKCLEEL